MRETKRRVQRLEQTTQSQSKKAPSVCVPRKQDGETIEAYLTRYRTEKHPEHAVCILPDNGR